MGGKNTQGLQQMMMEQINTHMQNKNEVEPLPHATYKKYSKLIND